MLTGSAGRVSVGRVWLETLGWAGLELGCACAQECVSGREWVWAVEREGGGIGEEDEGRDVCGLGEFTKVRGLDLAQLVQRDA